MNYVKIFHACVLEHWLVLPCTVSCYFHRGSITFRGSFCCIIIKRARFYELLLVFLFFTEFPIRFAHLFSYSPIAPSCAQQARVIHEKLCVILRFTTSIFVLVATTFFSYFHFLLYTHYHIQPSTDCACSQMMCKCNKQKKAIKIVIFLFLSISQLLNLTLFNVHCCIQMGAAICA